MELSFTARNVLIGATLLGALAGTLGSFALLRRQSLLGDALAHAALPGVCLAVIWTGAKTSLGLMLGAAAAGLLGMLAMLAITRQTRVKEDAALGVVLSVFFGFGIFLLTRIQHGGDAAQSGLSSFLFGQAATLLERDVRTMAILAAVAALAVGLLFKEFKLLAFDPDFAASLGFAPTPLAIGLTGLIVVAVVIGLQTVGVVLMVSLLIAPAAAARQWTDRFGTMVVLAGAIGATAGVAGAVISSEVDRLPTGPTVVLLATVAAAVSIAFAPRRGVVWAAVARRRRAARIRADAVLRDLAGRDPLGGSVGVPRRLRRAGLVTRADGRWRLTASGAKVAAAALHRERLWKQYLARQMDLPMEAVHHGADEIERVLPAAVRAALEAEMANEPMSAGGGAR